MKVIWRPEAEQQFSDIIDYLIINAGNRTAERLAEKIMNVTVKLSLQPGIGKIEPDLEGLSYPYRSIVADKNYKIIYCLNRNVVHIFQIWDCRQDPARLKKRMTGK